MMMFVEIRMIAGEKDYEEGWMRWRWSLVRGLTLEIEFVDSQR